MKVLEGNMHAIVLFLESKLLKRRSFVRKHFYVLFCIGLVFGVLVSIQLMSSSADSGTEHASGDFNSSYDKRLQDRKLEVLDDLIAMGAIREIKGEGGTSVVDEEEEKKQWEEAIKSNVDEPIPQTEPSEVEDKEETKKVTEVETAPLEETPLTGNDNCTGKWVYMYHLPPHFNQAFLDNCSRIHRSVDMCEAFSHSGAGWPANRPYANGTMPELLVPESAWYETDQFSLEITFHARMKEYPCLTENPLDAIFFYVPFYPGLAIFRSLYDHDNEKDRYAREIVNWLHTLPWWGRHQGRDHLMVITRVLIDFTRDIVRPDWGNRLMKMSHMRNASFIGIEAHPVRPVTSNAHSIPYPTSFHPSSDEDIHTWQNFVRNHKRKYLIGFAGVGHGMGATIRNILWRLCEAQPSDVCSFFDCKNRVCIMKPQNVIHFYLGGTFCLQPPGDTPTRKGLFDSILAGCIPVVFHDQTSYTYKWHLPENQEDLVIYMPMKNVLADRGAAVIPLLKTISPQQISRMQDRIIRMIPHIVYSMPGNTIRQHKDAFHIAVEGVLEKVSGLNLPRIVPETREETGVTS